MALPVAALSLTASRAMAPSSSRAPRPACAHNIPVMTSSSSDPLRAFTALQSGLTLRERRRIESGVLRNETLLEERLGVAINLFAICVISSVGLNSGKLPIPWDAPTFGVLSIAMGMLLQVSLSPTCLDGQGAFGWALRHSGWLTLSGMRELTVCWARLCKLPPVKRSVAALERRREVGRIRLMRDARRLGGLLQAGLTMVRAFAARTGVSAALLAAVGIWSRSPAAAALERWKGWLEWNRQQFLKDYRSQQTQEFMANGLQQIIEERRRKEAENR